MFLSKLLDYNHIAVQCHDAPDADAIAAGFGLYAFFRSRGKAVTLFYGGRAPVSKPNLLKMVNLLQIPLDHCPEPQSWPGLLLTADCQYGAGNVSPMRAEALAVVDHHIQELPPPPLHEIRPYLGSCSTLVWHLLGRAEFDLQRELGAEEARRLHTALFYGLFMDTGGLAEVRHPLDRDLRDSLSIDEGVFRVLKTSNLSLSDLNIASQALGGLDFNRRGRFAVVPVPPCDSNLLGFISDLVMQVDNIDVALVYSPVAGGVKYSVRSLMREAKASDIAAWLAVGLGSGGGHSEKAGGWLSAGKLQESLSGGENGLVAFFNSRMRAYQKAYAVIDRSATAAASPLPHPSDHPSAHPSGHTSGSSSGNPPASSSTGPELKEAPPPQADSLYEKRSLKLAYVPCAEVFPERALLHIRMLEGDISLAAGPETYLMIGLAGEVYPIGRAKFEATYTPLDGAVDYTFPYPPVVLDKNSGARLDLLALARPCQARGGGRVLARPLEHGLKLFTRWDSENYLKGEAGDWLVCPENDRLDAYIVKSDIFPRLYRPCPQPQPLPGPEADCSALNPAASPASLRVRKKVYSVQVRFAQAAGVLETLEGPVAYEAGDAIITGLAGESWPVRPERFKAAYVAVEREGGLPNGAANGAESGAEGEAASAAQNGELQDGQYRTRPLEAVALQIKNPFKTAGGNGIFLQGRAGDWLLVYAEGGRGVVRQELFSQMYEVIEA